MCSLEKRATGLTFKNSRGLMRGVKYSHALIGNLRGFNSRLQTRKLHI